MELEELKERIARLRAELAEMALAKDLNDPCIITKSCEVDRLIVEYHRLISDSSIKSGPG